MQALLASMIGMYLSVALRTTRWRFEGLEHTTPYLGGRPTIIAFWHERLPLMPMLWIGARRAAGGAKRTRVHVLVSRHRDGRLIGSMMRRFDMEVLHGSSSKGGPAVLREMMSVLAAGEVVAITPDGPRGPRRQAAPGVAQLAAIAGVTILPCAAQTTRRRVLSTWDKMVLPLPFGRGVVVCRPAMEVARERWKEIVPVIAAEMDRAAEQADRLCLA